MNQRTVIEKYMTQKHNAPVEHLWKKSPTDGICRAQTNKKWFAVLMTVHRNKLNAGDDGTVDILNLKCAPEIMGALLLSPGYRPAYHMSKIHWISIILDGTVNITEIKKLIDISYKLVTQ